MDVFIERTVKKIRKLLGRWARDKELRESCDEVLSYIKAGTTQNLSEERYRHEKDKEDHDANKEKPRGATSLAVSSCTWNDDHYGNAKGKKYHKSDDNEDEDEDDNQVVFRNHDKEERMKDDKDDMIIAAMMKDVQAYHEPRRGRG
jgi:hypothetical protein